VTTSKSCDICKRHRQDPFTGASLITRYTVMRQIFEKNVDGVVIKHTAAGAGGIDLCLECWTQVCKPNMRPLKRNPKLVFGRPR
jgi:hypothetical protein